MGPGPGPGMAQPGGYGGGWAPGPGPVPSQVRHRPGPGAVVAALGLLLFFMSLNGLPWISANGQEVNFPDIRDAFDSGAPLGGSRGDYLEVYAEWLWIGVLLFVAGAVVVSTLLVPASAAGRAVVGFLAFGVVGAIVMAVDKEGTAGPKICGVLMTVAAGGAHAIAVFTLFEDAQGVDPAYGVWAGVAGLAVVMIGCVMGTRVERLPAAMPAYR